LVYLGSLVNVEPAMPAYTGEWVLYGGRAAGRCHRDGIGYALCEEGIGEEIGSTELCKPPKVL